MPAIIYKTADGKRVPGVTTAIFKEVGGLMHWAWQEGIEGRDYRESRDRAANSGTYAHEMIEAHLLGDEWAPPADAHPEVVEKAREGFQQYLTWAQGSRVRIVNTEISLVSERLRVGGTPDAVGHVGDGGLALIDWKTSNAIHADYFIQLCAYKMIWDECFPDQPITGGIHVCRFSKDHADFEHRHFASDFEDGEDAFQLMREAYEVLKRIKKRVR